MLTYLLEGCYRGQINVTPKNWNTAKALVRKDWKIHYRFYDPAFKDHPKLKKGKQVIFRGMNEFKTLEERQEITAALVEQEKYRLDELGYNPITDLFMATAVKTPPADCVIMDIGPNTPFIKALYDALPRLEVVHEVRIDIKSVIGGVEIVSRQLYDQQRGLRYIDLQVCQVSRKHIKNILDLCAKTRKRWSAKRHNMYKCYLSMLFTELLELEAVDMNPTRDIPSKTQTKSQREVYTQAELERIDRHLKVVDYCFWRYFRIFFYSGARTTELFQVRKNRKVNLKEQIFTVRVIKGGQDKEDFRGISNESKDLWMEVWNEAKEGQVLFSRGLRPGDRPIRKDQALRRWKKHVKDSVTGLGINKDFYLLKHTHSDAIAEKLSLQHAQAADGHTTPVVTMTYTPGEKKRALKRVSNAGIKLGQSASTSG